MVYTHAIAGDKRAARFLSPLVPELAPQIALDILSKKLASCQEFNSTFPGYGGFLPWFTHGDVPLQPTWDWVNRVPALDNGCVSQPRSEKISLMMTPWMYREFIWAIYSAIEALNARGDHQARALASGWQTYLDYIKTTVKQVGAPLRCYLDAY